MPDKTYPGPENIHRHLLDNGQISDIRDFNPDILHIFSKEVLSMLRNGETGWETMVPTKVVNLIKEKCLFGYPSEQLQFEY